MQHAGLVVEVGEYTENPELRLQGSCLAAPAVRQLELAIEWALLNRRAILWIDCHQLQSVDYTDQQAMLRLEQQAHFAGIKLYWCGLSPRVVQQLSVTGLYLLLRSMPAVTYQGQRLS